MRMSCLMICLWGFASIGYSQSSLNSSSSDLSGAGSVSYSLGQLSTGTLSGTGGTLFQGVQIADEQITLIPTDVLSISSQAMTVYPNPTIGDATLELPSVEANTHYVLFNSQGSELLRNQISDSQTTVPTNALSTGVYFLQVLDKNNASTTFRIIKE